MKWWIVQFVGLAMLLACIAALTAGWGISYRRFIQAEVKLPGGIVLGANGQGSNLRLSATRWGAESTEWWRWRHGTEAMRVTGQTMTYSGGTLFAIQANVDFGTSRWRGMEWGGGAKSRTPLTTQRGIMSTPMVPYRFLIMPWSYPMAVLLPLALVWIAALIRRARRVPPGHCRNCGYDMRATPEQCPECGAAVTPKPLTTPPSPGAA